MPLIVQIELVLYLYNDKLTTHSFICALEIPIVQRNGTGEEKEALTPLAKINMYGRKNGVEEALRWD